MPSDSIVKCFRFRDGLDVTYPLTSLPMYSSSDLFGLRAYDLRSRLYVYAKKMHGNGMERVRALHHASGSVRCAKETSGMLLS